jgi:hypothetical protein
LTSLASLLGALITVLQSHPICEQTTLVETKTFSPDQFFFKVRADLPEGNKFQVRIYFNQGHIDYAYQLFTDVPLLRWDSKEEFRHLETYPHHHHDDQGNIEASPLIGDPVGDIEVVLQEVSAFLSKGAKE